VSKKCCRSTPRCADCPVRAVVAARRRRGAGDGTALVEEVLGGRPPRPLPNSVVAALEQLSAAAAAGWR
jgi:hypothetical protein